MKFILGTKQSMTQVFDEAGTVHPVTVVKAGPMTVTQVKNVVKDGYNAVQFGYGSRNAKNINKPMTGHMKGLNSSEGAVGQGFAHLKEFKLETSPTQAEPEFRIGDKVDLSVFANGDKVTVSSISKGKGFQGVVKRHQFEGGPRSHGQKHSEREPGSIGGAGRDGGRVAKGKRMAGRMGNDRITSKGLTIVAVKPETGEIFVRGAIAGRRGTLVEVKSEK